MTSRPRMRPITEPSSVHCSSDSAPQLKLSNVAEEPFALRSRPTFGRELPLMKPSSASRGASVLISDAALELDWQLAVETGFAQPLRTSLAWAVFAPVHSPDSVPELHTICTLPVVSRMAPPIHPPKAGFAPGPLSHS